MQSTPVQRSRLAQAVVTALWAGLVALPFLASSAAQLSLIVGALTLFVAAIVATFSLRYMRADPRADAFFITLALLVAAVLGFVFTQNLALFAMAWIASGWLLARLIGHTEGWAEARFAGRRAMRAFAIGDTALVAALALLVFHAASLDLGTVLASLPAMPAPLVTATALLLLVAAAARSAMVPFSGWLLSSMTAPTPVSALMHAGFVNAGGFVLLRFAPVLEAAPIARNAAIVIGLAAAIYGIGIMTVRPDIKRSLAGSTVSQMGFMIMSCGLGAYAAALWHIVAHGLFKAWLFLGSGSAIGSGTKSAQQAPATLNPTPALTLAISAATLGIAMALVVEGSGAASLVPLLLGTATAAATTLGGLAAAPSGRARVMLAGAVAGLIAFHAGGLAVTHAALGADAVLALPDWTLLALLAAFLGLWVWQQLSLTRRNALPARLYVHLLNAGTLKGDLK